MATTKKAKAKAKTAKKGAATVKKTVTQEDEDLAALIDEETEHSDKRRNFRAHGFFLVDDFDIINELDEEEYGNLKEENQEVLVYTNFIEARRHVLTAARAEREMLLEKIRFYKKLTPEEFRKGIRYESE